MHSSPLLQKPYFAKNQHSGIFLRLYSCMNSQLLPFLHNPRSQCLQTVLAWAERGNWGAGRKLRGEAVVWRRGQAEPRGQLEVARKSGQSALSVSSFKWSVCLINDS